MIIKLDKYNLDKTQHEFDIVNTQVMFFFKLNVCQTNNKYLIILA